jgi:ribosome-associated translation inhibitor RaiA
MKITVKARNFEVSDELRELVRRRAHYALGRFGREVGRVVVTLETGATPKAQVSVRGRTLWNVLIRDEGPWIGAAIGRAMNRAGRAVARRMDRQLRRKLVRTRRAEQGVAAPAHEYQTQEQPVMARLLIVRAAVRSGWGANI